MHRIYCLASDDEVLYVGKTIKLLKMRERLHRAKTNMTHSRYIPEGTIWRIIFLELVEDECSEDAERFYIDFLEPKYNKCIPARTDEERRECKRIYHLKKKSLRLE